MKDAYSFDATVAGLDASYKKMYDAYCRIFQRCGLEYVTVEADSGGMGGTDTEEFMVPCAAGEDVLISSDKGNYAANVEKAETGPRDSDLSGEPTGELEVVDTPGCTTIDQVAEFFKKQLKSTLKPRNMLKTLVLQAAGAEMGENDPTWVVAVVRGDHELNEMKLLTRVREQFETIESLEMAAPDQAAQAGFVIGFVGPHVLPETCNSVMFVDPDAAQGGFWVSGANQPDRHVKHFNWKRDVTDPLEGTAQSRLFVSDIRNAQAGDPSPKGDGGVLRESRGIEVGHVFKLGTKYARTLGATYLDENGQEQTCIMGCYGIGINRILASAIEMSHDENGCVLPVNIAPFEVIVIQVNNDSQPVRDAAMGIYEALRGAGVDVLLDDRDARPGVKFKDADLIGFPVRVVVGDRGLKDGQVEVKTRTQDKPDRVQTAQAADIAVQALAQMRSAQ
jgi:prolyl-tRNA synthetase